MTARKTTEKKRGQAPKKQVKKRGLKKRGQTPKKSAKTTGGKSRGGPPSGDKSGSFFYFPIFLLVMAGQLLVLGARTAEGRVLMYSNLWPLALWALSGAVLCLVLKGGRFSGSSVLVSGGLLLSGIGVLVRSRMSGVVPDVSDMNVLIQPLGVILLLLAWMMTRKGRVKILQPFWGLALLAAFALAGGMLLLGTRYRGGLYAPGGMTPTELLKLFVPVAAAGFFAKTISRWHGRPPWFPPFAQLMLLLVVWAGFCALLALQRDLGLVLLLSLILLVVLICATGRVSWGVGALGSAVAAGWGVVRVFAHGARRVEAWMDPFADPTGSGWQVLQGLSGLYAGGLAGTGLGSGRPDRLPIAGSDFVYAVYGEELGFLGSICLLFLFAHLFRAAILATRRQSDDFAHLFAAGITAAFVVQTLVNIAGVVTLLPITGITLPYISQGGSSYWVTSVWMGCLMGLSETNPSGSKRKARKD
ncbi:MAG: FtsW/RodA/SpoVE family cell cycle protein [Verrucomicrobia bacterium]|nr:FtsW/RodA/SpoVE family cell cycle protein [Verrucomicrobiota bacterium]MCH8514595.1 FtsW/RodA/SpoVE family cell cycle protein [Kiritimatiellia bacterium]